MNNQSLICCKNQEAENKLFPDFRLHGNNRVIELKECYRCLLFKLF